MFPPSAGERHFFQAVAFLLSGKELGMRVTFPCPSISSIPRQWQGGISFTPGERKDSTKSSEASHRGSVVVGLERDSALSHACHKPSGAGIPLASVQVCLSVILENRHLHVSSLSQLPCKLMEMEARSELLRCIHLVTVEVSEVVQDKCRQAQTLMEQFIEKEEHLGASP